MKNKTKKINFILKAQNFTLASDGVKPKDLEWYIVLFGNEDDCTLMVGAYYEENQEFYSNFGLGGSVLSLKDAIAWIEFDKVNIEKVCK